MTYLRGVVDELRAAQEGRPPGAHVAWPEIEWPEATDEPLDTTPVLLPFHRVEIPPEPTPVPEAEFLTTEQEERRLAIKRDAERRIKRSMRFLCAAMVTVVLLLVLQEMRR